MLSDNNECPLCKGVQIVQVGVPEGRTKLTWYECSSCRQLWFRSWPPDDDACACQTIGLNSPNAAETLVTLRCVSCEREWQFPLIHRTVPSSTHFGFAEGDALHQSRRFLLIRGRQRSQSLTRHEVPIESEQKSYPPGFYLVPNG